jgi:transposase InsO family protein
MSKARLIITAVVVEGRSKSEVGRDYDVSRYWVHQLVRRYQVEGEAAFQPRSRRPHTSPHAVSAEVEEQIVRLRKVLSRQGLDAGADTIHTHLGRRTPSPVPDDGTDAGTAVPVPSVATIWRILTRRGFVTPQPQKRPKSSWHRFAAEQPNERWQADTTHWQLTDGTPVEILNILDDHSRVALASVPRRTITGPDVLHTFQDAFLRWGIPASVLTDNGAIFTGRQRGGGRVALEVELGRLGVRFDHSRPYHPQTCGKVCEDWVPALHRPGLTPAKV